MAARSMPTMPSFFAGQKLTATVLNLVGSYAVFWANPPDFRMHQSVTQSVPNTAWTQITCDTPDHDSDSGRASGTPYSYVIQVGMTGLWSFGWSLPWASNATGARAANLYRNGTAASTYTITPASSTTATCNGTVDRILCNAGDTMALYGWQSSGAALGTFIAADSVPAFWGRLDSLANP